MFYPDIMKQKTRQTLFSFDQKAGNNVSIGLPTLVLFSLISTCAEQMTTTKPLLQSSHKLLLKLKLTKLDMPFSPYHNIFK